MALSAAQSDGEMTSDGSVTVRLASAAAGRARNATREDMMTVRIRDWDELGTG